MVSSLFATCVALASAATANVGGFRPMNGWAAIDVSRMPRSHRLTLKLKRRSPDALAAAIDQVSDPASPRFREYLSNSEIAALVEPVPGAFHTVETWARALLAEDSVITPSPHGDYVFVEAHPDSLEVLFGHAIDFVPFAHTASRHTRVGGRDHVEDVLNLLPTRVQSVVETVFGVNEFFPVPNRPAVVHDDDRVGAGEKGDAITPTLLRQHYNITTIGGDRTSQGIAAFEDAEFRQEDVDTFTSTYNLKDVVIDVLGPNDGGYYGEAGLDTQYILTAGQGVRTWFLSHQSFDLLDFSFMVMNMTKPPKVVSISWGSGESSYRLDHMTSANDEFAKMGLQGVSIFTASGDDGCGRRSFEKCYDPTWPTTSPYITSVGGTYLTGNQETGWVSSGGGFSSVFDRPRYQDAAVGGYLNSGAAIPPPAKFSVQGRATPDLSGVATNYLVTSFNTQGKLSGTSAATPVVAGMVSLVNDMLAQAGKPPVGFINPALYAAHARGGDNFLGYDITEGDNKLGRCQGFPAVPGYDAITGFGSPTFDKLYNVLAK